MGPITELNPPLAFLAPEQQLELSAPDAARLELRSGEAVDVSQNGSRVRARVAIRERVLQGSCFLIEGIEGANANALAAGTAVQITPVARR